MHIRPSRVRNARELVLIVAAFATAAVILAGCSPLPFPLPWSAGAPEGKATDEAGQGQKGEHDEADASSADDGRDEKSDPAAQDEGAKRAEDDTEAKSEREPLDPRDLAAGEVLTEEDVERGGGVDAFFWAEEIPDEVFTRMEGKSFGPDCTLARSDLRYVKVLHSDAEGNTIVGELVVNQAVADEVVDIFHQLYDARYPIKKMHLIDDYDGDDDASCADGNTAAFNYRNIVFSNQLSNHAYGLAIDINTFENPYYIPSTGYVWPPEASPYLDRSLTEPYMIHPGDLCYDLFVQYGWSWGGNWGSPIDYQHFEKPWA